MARKPNVSFSLRKQRVRTRIKKESNRLRLSVYRSDKNIYAQLIDDVSGKTLVTASSIEKENKIAKGNTKEAAKDVGERIGLKAQEIGIKEVVFDRGGRPYHGRIKELANGARKYLEF